MHNGLHEPRAVIEGRSRNSRAFGWNPIGSHQVNLELGPGASETFAFLLAYVEPGEPKFESPGEVNKIRARELLARHGSPAAVDAAFLALGQVWRGLLDGYQVRSPNEHVDRMVNVWNQYQCMATFNLSRSASLFETGIGRGMGFRDSNQDILGFVHMVPARARQRILDLAATQLSDGTCYHQYQPLTKKGNAEIGGDFYDDHLWLILSTCAYIKETGDRGILEAPVGYADRPAGRADLLHHLETSIAYTLSHRGPHRLPLIGHADWNDCLNLNCFSREPNESFQCAGDVKGSRAESVMIAGLFLYAAREMERLYAWLGRDGDAGRMRGHYDDMLGVVEREAWDGEWYRRAYDAEGRPVGSAGCAEGRIFIESQAWCVLGGAGRDNGRAAKALASLHERLYTPDGIILQQPAYNTYHLELGEITSYPPGVKENAGIFCHNNAWVHLALCALGRGNRALAYYLSICPSAKEDRIETYRCEPYVYAQMIAGRDAPCAGEAKNSWLTGTAAWTFVAVSQGILGVTAEYDGLRVNPCIPRDWGCFTVTRRFRGVEYQIAVRNPQGVSRGVGRLSVNGVPVPGDLVPLHTSGPVKVEVRLGSQAVSGHTSNVPPCSVASPRNAVSGQAGPSTAS